MKITPFLLSGALALAVALPLAGSAQTAPGNVTPSNGTPAYGRHHGHGPRFMRMFQGVNLSDAQRTQIRTLFQQFRQAHPKGSPPDKASRQQFHQQLMGILTPAQQAQVKANMQRMRQERRNHMGQGRNNVFPSQPAPQASPKA